MTKPLIGIPVPPTTMGPLPALWLLALITFSGTVAMHMFVPALPAAALFFDAPADKIQLTLTVYIIGLAVGQLFYGPLSDCYGRRPVLLIGISLYVAGSLGALLSTSIQSLVVFRVLQALGGCSGLVLGKAIVLDCARGAEATRKLATLNIIVTAGPALAPLIGVALVEYANWRAIFAFLSIAGLTSLLCVWRLLPETLPARNIAIHKVMNNYFRLMKSRRFLCLAVSSSLATTSSYAFIATAPFIYVRDLHNTEGEMALYLALNIVGVWLGNLLVSRQAHRMKSRRLLMIGQFISMATALVLLPLAVWGHINTAALVVLMMMFSFGVGIVAPVAVSEVLSVNPQAAGSAAGLFGCLQMGCGAVCTYLAGLADQPLLGTPAILLTASVVASIGFRWAR